MWPARRVSSSGLEASASASSCCCCWLLTTPLRGVLQLGCVWSLELVSSSCGSVWQLPETVGSPLRLMCQGRSLGALPRRAGSVLPQLRSCGRLVPFCRAL